MSTSHVSAGIIGALALASSLIAPAHAATVTMGPAIRNTLVTAAAPACAVRERSAALSESISVDIPFVAEEEGVRGITTLQVDLSSTGALMSEEVIKSSGHQLLDDEAMRSARLAPFSPEIRDCESVAGSYLYIVDFTR